ncbi:MAG: tRNA lysidine(34) synthetase TilS [Chitinispirillales bacterium]|jgi:tRNA(Ile)-lysidine synthase|nr:tRNA lysidine(34) synthetase TilS [Chitinispirillales bacterium]
MIISKVKNFLSKYSINNCSIAIAFSGGTDSTALFHILCEIKNEFNLRLFAIHINYHLRENDSDEDQNFVEYICKKHDVELFLKTLHMSNNMSGLEEIARCERYKFFERIKNEKNIKFIATAHTANDQAETLIFRLVRKSGMVGAAGILQFREDGIIRPLLCVTRNELLEYLTKNNLSWREDKSNFDLKFSRNLIRHNVIPELEKINPSAVIHLAGFCEFIQQTNKKQICNGENNCFLFKKDENITKIMEICFEKELVLNEVHCENIKKSRSKTGNVLLLPNDFNMIVLKNFLLFKKNNDKSLEIKEIIVNESEKEVVINDLWKIIISNEIPKKGENAAVVSKNDYPLRIKKLSQNDYLKNDTKTAFERMKKIGLSKFERENSPAVFNSKGNLLASAYCSWKFDGNITGFRWIKVRNADG